MWVILTETDYHRKISINTSNICCMRDSVSAAFGTSGTFITFEKDHYIYVKETQEQILALIPSTN